jgi:hypothetical protein
LFIAALDIKTRDESTVSSINSLLSQYCKALHFFFANFYVWGGAPTVRFAPVAPWAKTGPVCTHDKHEADGIMTLKVGHQRKIYDWQKLCYAFALKSGRGD